MTPTDIIGLISKRSKVFPETLEIYYDDIFPEEMFKERHPNYSKEELDYQRAVYRNPVKPKFGEALFEVKKIFNDENWDIECADEKVKAKIDELNLGEWFKDLYCEATILDPQLTLTFNIKESEIKTDAEGNILKTEFIPVKPYIVRSRDLIFKDDNNIIYKIAGNARYNYVHISKEVGLRYEQYNIDTENDAMPTVSISLDGNINKLHRKGDGTKKIKDNELVIESFFQPAVPILNSILFNSLKKEIIETRMLFPTPYIVTQTCECESGAVYEKDGKGDTCKVECKKCNGTGKKLSFNVHSTIEIEQGSSILDKDKNIPIPGFGYVDVPVNGYNALSESLKEYLKQAFKWLLNDYSDSNPKGSETALGMMIDREEKHTAMVLYTQTIFETMRWWINEIFIPLSFPTQAKVIAEVNTYNNFRVVSDAEINLMFAKLLAENAPMNTLRELLKDYYTGRKQGKKFIIVDRYFNYRNTQTSLSLVAAGVLSKQGFSISENIMKWVDDLDLSEYDVIDDAAFREIDAILKEKANEQIVIPIPSSGIVEFNN